MTTENYYQMTIWDMGYPQEDSAEHKGPKGACSTVTRDVNEMAGTGLMERILPESAKFWLTVSYKTHVMQGLQP